MSVNGMESLFGGSGLQFVDVTVLESVCKSSVLHRPQVVAYLGESGGCSRSGMCGLEMSGESRSCCTVEEIPGFLGMTGCGSVSRCKEPH